MITERCVPSGAGHIINKLPHYSEPFYERAQNDPFLFADDDAGAHEDLRQLDMAGLAYATERHNLRETAEFAADLAYLGFMDGEDTVRGYATIASEALVTCLKNEGLKPSDRLSLSMRLLDVLSLQNFSDYQRAIGSLDAANKANALRLLEARAQTLINNGANMLIEAWHSLAQFEHGSKQWEVKERGILVGKMFELLYITNRRREIYEREQYDETLVLGATEFQDGPAIVFNPNHNFDVVELSATGTVECLTQCKAGKNDQVYAEPITKVSGRSMREFFENPAPYVDALKFTIGNNPNVSEATFRQAVDKINSLFTRDYRTVGQQVVSAAR